MLFGKVRRHDRRAGPALPLAEDGLAGARSSTGSASCHVLDMRLDQDYLRSQPVNSEEGAPMGIGIWYEMFISDPVAYLFKNADPRGSLAANVSNATVRCLSNMPLADMLVNRHAMSQHGARRGVAEVARMGLPARVGLHPQGSLPRRRR